MDHARGPPRRQDSMENEKHYFRVGLYLVLLSAGLALFAVWLLSSGLRHSIDYRIYFNESVSGLSLGSPVKYRGVNVGKVKQISIDKNDSQRIEIIAEIDDSTPIRVGTVASLKLQGITGTVFIELSGDAPPGAPKLKDEQHSKEPIIPSSPSSINAIMNQLPQIMDKLSHFADQLEKLSTDENIAHFDEVLSNLSMATADMRQVLHDTKGNIIQSTEQINDTMSNLRRASRDVSDVTERVSDDPSSLLFSPKEEGVPAP